MINYSILVNTCDKFEDCWNPFFKLMSKYWHDCHGKIYLNTEYKDFAYDGINIICVKGCEHHGIERTRRATWSQCLKWALESMDTDIILYMQEDYFLKDNVKNDIIEEYVDLMGQDESIKCIHLTDQAIQSSGTSKYPNLDEVICQQHYRVSCQAALWRKEELLLILRERESAWEFEEFGSKRSAAYQHNYLVVNSTFVQLNKFEIIPYIFTGIVQGRWYYETKPLFEKNGIDMDYLIRGFCSEKKSKPVIKRIQYRLNKIPKIICNYIDVLKIKNHE